MKKLITRRDILLGGLTSVSGLLLTGCSKTLPPTYGNILRMSDNLTYSAHRALLPGKSLVKEYRHQDISSFPATGTTNPGDPARPKPNEVYRRLQSGGFADWRLSIEGLVAKPGEFSLSELKRLPARTQITRHTCEEGWSAIAEWTGVPLSRVLDAAGLLPNARFVSFYSYDDWADSIDLLDALHPQTLLAYGMNGRDLPVQHGAPVRLRVETQLGYKSMKYLQRIVVTSDLDDGGAKGNPQNGWAWYVGI
ncbi:MAG TPA: molybdopterin-dependent oxidoreductase [Blastocatellia bacterium]|nr:molybdopterin-dependent oxidoreductase [Blastocatellia bacterium]